MRKGARLTRIVACCLVAAGTAAPVPSARAASGDQVWVARDAGPNGAYDQFGGMATSPDGSTVYVARTSKGAFAVVAHDALTGTPVWAVHTLGPGGAQVFADAVALSPDGARLFVTGDAELGTDTRSALTVAYDTADGSVLWSAQIPVNDGREVIPRRIAVSPNGTRVFVTGSRNGRHGIDDFWDFFTVAYSAVSGDRLWGATYNGPSNGGDTAEGIGVSPDGTRVFVTGTSKASGSDRDITTIAYAAADGSERWVSRYDGEADDFATDLVVDPDGSHLYVAGFGRASLDVPHGYRVLAYVGATGHRVGVARYSDGGDDFASDLAISTDGSRVFVTGSGGGDYVTVAIDALGAKALWAARYDGGHGIDDAYGVDVSPDGTRVYVTGESGQGQVACFSDIRSTAYATVGYDGASGAERWVRRYAGLKIHPDQARQIAVSPDGSLVFVAGNSDFVCKTSDVATVAYQARA